MRFVRKSGAARCPTWPLRLRAGKGNAGAVTARIGSGVADYRNTTDTRSVVYSLSDGCDPLTIEVSQRN
jgi:hypothetical protein